jgi:hypothetical protein
MDLKKENKRTALTLLAKSKVLSLLTALKRNKSMMILIVASEVADKGKQFFGE